MKKILITWYGITDFRASLGIETTVGPILGALKAEDYTEVKILGYTNRDKNIHNAESVKADFSNELKSLSNQEYKSHQQFISRFANTHIAHEHFLEWLKMQTSKTDKNVDINLYEVNLKHLNDTEGIYEAATGVISEVSNYEGEKYATLYLSPGTPVMAFVWAFAALRFPNLGTRLIASPQAEKAPEKIALPNEWLEWHGRQVKTQENKPEQYDVIFHLFGEQRMPNLLGVLQFSSKRHVFLNSKQFPADIMKQFIGSAEFSEVAVDPYDPENVRRTILDILAAMPFNIRVGFNLTGGTKLMYAGALAACRKVNATPYYFNSRNNQVVNLNDFKSIDTKLIPSVETFIQLNGNNLFISKAGHWDDIPDITNPTRTALTMQLWAQHSKIAGLYRKLASYNDDPGCNFELSHKDISVALKDGHKAEIIFKNRSGKERAYRFQNWPDFAKYLSGGWFEEYTFMKLQPLVDAGLIKDIRIGLEVSFKEEVEDKSSLSIGEQLSNLFGDTYQELDITFTDGRRLYVIECKAGNVKSEHVMKLQNIVRYFGGIEGRAVLASCFKPMNKVVRKKIDDSKILQLASGNNLIKQLEVMILSGGRH